MSYRELPLVEELSAAPDAWDLFRRVAGLPHAVFFDSASRHATLGRYSFVAADPFEWIWSRGKETHVRGDAATHKETDPFSLLAAQLALYRQEKVEGLPPFQ